MRLLSSVAALLPLLPAASACDSCYGPVGRVEHVRHVKRMQAGATDASYGPTRPLEWGQLNFLHTSDTHGWLSGHIKEQNYGADFGDFVSFATHMKQKASDMGVDLLLVDTGDLHDGTGLSDSTTVDGELTNRIMQELSAYDVLTIGNHELYVAEVAYQDFYNFSSYWGEKYLTSNVQILNPETYEWEYLGQKYRHFTTEQGLRVMALGVLFDFKGNANNSKVIPAATMVQQQWFRAAIRMHDVDLFLLVGHNIARPATSGSTWQTVYDAIRAVRPTTPIQIFGGHSHIRDFAVVDDAATALESGRYCETVGWLAMSGFNRTGRHHPCGVAAPPSLQPTRKAVANATSPWTYARRYLDWNRYTFSYHAKGRANASDYDTPDGRHTTAHIAADRDTQRLNELHGCVPQSYCISCAPFGSETNIFTVLADAASNVVNASRAAIPRMVALNTGSVRFDMYKGPFTSDDNYIVSPFKDIFLYIPEVPYSLAAGLLDGLNAGGASKRSVSTAALLGRDTCVDPVIGLAGRDIGHDHMHGSVRRQVVTETAGYTTTDDFGTDGDDTAHTAIASYENPDYFMGYGGFPASSTPDVVDVVFLDYIEDYVLAYLGDGYNSSMSEYYIDEEFSSRDYLAPYVELKWGANGTSCP